MVLLWRPIPFAAHHFLALVLALIALGYFVANSLFASLSSGRNCIANARPGNFLDAFFFSVQTMASIGYGAMYPLTVYANAMVAEALTGLMGLAMGSGLMFARSPDPRRVLFSRVAVIAPWMGCQP